jgi:hypothetical protein
MLRKLVVTAIVALAVGAAATAAVAAGGEQATVETFEASFTIAAGQCPQLPPDLEVSGVGQGHSTFITNQDGTHVKVLTRIAGTASDSEGGQYRFSYHNNLVATLGGSGTVTDHFTIKGRGAAAGLHSQWAADIELDEQGGLVDFEFTEFIGDPFDLVTGAPRCDPL